MLNAQQSFALLWKRVVAALSLLAAAALAPAAVSSPVGSGMCGSRATNGAALANAASALLANVTAVTEGGQQTFSGAASRNPPAKAAILAALQGIAPPGAETASPPADDGSVLRATHFARAGLARAPPSVRHTV